MSPRSWIAALVATVTLVLAGLGTTELTPLAPGVAAEIEGAFPRDGHFHAEPLAGGARLRAWGSLDGDGARTGAVALGPFPAPARLRFGVTGFPAQPTNTIAIERVATGERQSVRLPVDIGVRWNVIDVDLPAAWVGQPVRLLARDSGASWLGITEPVRGGRGEGLNGLRATLAAWAVNGLLLALLWQAALHLLVRRGWGDAEWQPLLAGGVVAAIGYVAFWIYFAHATAGKIFSVALVLAAAGDLARRWRARMVLADGMITRLTRLAWLAAAIGAFHLTLLHLYPNSREFDALAANRFRENMPGDNTLPYNLAAALYAGVSPKVPGAAYQTSDRPPLQSGWQLLTWPFGAALGFEDRTASGTAAVWLQLLWVPAVYGLLRTLRLPAHRAFGWIGACALSGFFLQHTIYTWPKFAAAAFACGAFACWLPRADRALRREDFLLGAALAALGWLAHGGVAFAYLALAPWLAWRMLRDETRSWAMAALVFAIFALPWVAYQRCYEPPANTLLKEHLAGVEERDARTTWQTMRDAYRALSWPEILARRETNLALQVGGDWRSLFDFSPANTAASARRAVEFFHTGRALTWWVFGLPAAVLLLTLARRRPPGLVALAVWTVATVLVWCALMFVGGHAVIHQGSFTVPLVLFILCSAALDAVGAWTLIVVALLQAATLATTYVVPNAVVTGPASGLPFVLAAALGLIAVCVAAWRRPDSPTA